MTQNDGEVGLLVAVREKNSRVITDIVWHGLRWVQPGGLFVIEAPLFENRGENVPRERHCTP